MKMNRKLPTNRNGQVYYGPKTMAQALQVIHEMDAPADKVADQMEEAGYKVVAHRLRARLGTVISHTTEPSNIASL
jgi:hypothetical protein